MPQTPPEPGAGSRPIVLFLDENHDTLALYEAYFGHNGYSVLTSSQGAIAIRLAETHPVKVAVVGFDVPEKNGHDAVLALKGVRPTLPVILVSSDENIPPEMLQAVDFFVLKRSGPRRLGIIIDALVRG